MSGKCHMCVSKIKFDWKMDNINNVNAGQERNKQKRFNYHNSKWKQNNGIWAINTFSCTLRHTHSAQCSHTYARRLMLLEINAIGLIAAPSRSENISKWRWNQTKCLSSIFNDMFSVFSGIVVILWVAESLYICEWVFSI